LKVSPASVSMAVGYLIQQGLAGVRFVNPPEAITAGVNRGGYACYFLDPDDITLELVQPPSTP
ncbi:VOC family protein, partial [Nonomuraea sp. NPDC049784]|uniref:VOC family protein n=1 Tax=Nonomuraea sp. NPDC049784 TaxID=3154361 RepID=UPI0033CC8CCE